MQRPTQHVLLLMLCTTVLSAAVLAQTKPAPTGKTITIRVLDAKTAHSIVPSNFLVRINHQKTIHADWVTQNENRSATLTVPADATDVTIQATFDSAMQIFVNCDTALEKVNPLDHWYSISTIISSGVVAPNGCSKMKETAHPGEFIFFVRKQNFRERTQDDFSY